MNNNNTNNTNNNIMAKQRKSKFKAPASDRPVKLKKGDQCIARFLNERYECTVIEVMGKHQYKLRTQRGTVFPSVTWGVLLVEYCPWHISTKISNDNKFEELPPADIQAQRGI
jgi:hypothetical protein